MNSGGDNTCRLHLLRTHIFWRFFGFNVFFFILSISQVFLYLFSTFYYRSHHVNPLYSPAISFPLQIVQTQRKYFDYSELDLKWDFEDDQIVVLQFWSRKTMAEVLGGIKRIRYSNILMNFENFELNILRSVKSHRMCPRHVHQQRTWSFPFARTSLQSCKCSQAYLRSTVSSIIGLI